jgi:hypothetical protein
VAVAFHSEPRLTQDIDAVALTNEEDLEALISAGAPFGIESRIPDAVDFARRARILLLHHRPTGVDLDVSLGALDFEIEMIDRAEMRQVGGISIPIITAEDLIIMKLIAGRRQDLADIERVMEANPGLDVARVRRWTEWFGDVLDSAEPVRTLETFLEHPRTRRPGNP